MCVYLMYVYVPTQARLRSGPRAGESTVVCITREKFQGLA